jgi:hypothetical protein
MSYSTRRTNIFATLDKAKTSTENIRALNLKAARITTVQATKLPFQEKVRKNTV